jgi:regulator of replication initiation timing
MASLLLAALLATHIGAALGDQPIPHSAEPALPAERLSYKGWAALRLENVRLRRRLAKTQRALETVSRQAEACAVEAKDCGELQRAFVILELENQKLRWANARLAERPDGPQPGGQALTADGGKPHVRRFCLRSP